MNSLLCDMKYMLTIRRKKRDEIFPQSLSLSGIVTNFRCLEIPEDPNHELYHLTLWHPCHVHSNVFSVVHPDDPTVTINKIVREMSSYVDKRNGVSYYSGLIFRVKITDRGLLTLDVENRDYLTPSWGGDGVIVEDDIPDFFDI